MITAADRQQHAARSLVDPADLAAVLLLLAVFSLTTGYSYPAIAFNLAARGYSAGTIGAQAACAGLGILVGAVLMPPLAQRFGAWRLALVGLYGTVLSIAAFGLTENLTLWFVLRFVLGAMVNILFVVSDTWINQLAPEALRGRIIAVYAATNAGAFALGPLLVPLVGYSGLASFGVMAGVVGVMGLALIRLRRVERPVEPAPLAVSLRVVAAIPVLLLAVLAFGFHDGATLALWVVYAAARGLGETMAALTLAAIMLGSVVLQLPIGWLADRVSRRRLLALLAAVAFGGAASLPLVELTSWWGLAVLLIWGAAAFGVHTLSLTLIGQHLSGVRLVAATAAFGMAWGLGALAGPWLTGLLMDRAGPALLPATIAAIYGLLTLAARARAPVRAAPSSGRRSLPKMTRPE
jgi:MFS family permease